MTTYKESGVDVEAGEEAVDRIKPMVRETFTSGVLADIGSFGSYFELDISELDQPVLVSSIDGVGTKVEVARLMEQFDRIGQDLVNHCVNDIAVCGARPLYFLDYMGVGRLTPDVAEDIVRGFADACSLNQCALVGGEMAEMPDVYGDTGFDLVGCIVGVVEKGQILNGSTTQPGDVVIGLPSSGLHTNGYTLARAVLFDAFEPTTILDELDGESVGEALLRVHRSYLHAIQAIVRSKEERGIGVRGFAHITGGGLPGNVARILPKGRSAQIDYDRWQRPLIFRLIQEVGDVPESDMRQTFNCGIGLVAVVDEQEVDVILNTLQDFGEQPVVIGHVT